MIFGKWQQSVSHLAFFTLLIFMFKEVFWKNYVSKSLILRSNDETYIDSIIMNLSAGSMIFSIKRSMSISVDSRDVGDS